MRYRERFLWLEGIEAVESHGNFLFPFVHFLIPKSGVWLDFLYWGGYNLLYYS